MKKHLLILVASLLLTAGIAQALAQGGATRFSYPLLTWEHGLRQYNDFLFLRLRYPAPAGAASNEQEQTARNAK